MPFPERSVLRLSTEDDPPQQVREGGAIVAEDVDPSKCKRGRPRKHFDGKAQRDRLHITPDEDLAEVKRLAELHDMTESAVGALGAAA